MVPAPAMVATGAPAAGPSYGPGEDRHWFRQDDYLISERQYESGWIYVKLAKMKQAPTPASRDEALFFSLTETKDLWTKYFFRTRPAEASDLALGAVVICFEGNGGGGGEYRGPSDRNSARTGAWFMSRITDLAEMYKQLVGVDTYKCSPDALRVPVR
jgi:hypothetical protein